MTQPFLDPKCPNQTQMPNNILLEKWADIGFFWQGQVPVQAFSRLCQAVNDADNHQDLSIKMTLTKKQGILWLVYDVLGAIQLTCQRCLSPLDIDLSKQYLLAIIHDESQIASLDGAEFVFLDEVCPDNRKILPVKDLLEDELLLCLPLSSRHDSCQLPVDIQEFDDTEDSKADNPFAILSQLKIQ